MTMQDIWFLLEHGKPAIWAKDAETLETTRRKGQEIVRYSPHDPERCGINEVTDQILTPAEIRQVMADDKLRIGSRDGISGPGFVSVTTALEMLGRRTEAYIQLKRGTKEALATLERDRETLSRVEIEKTARRMSLEAHKLAEKRIAELEDWQRRAESCIRGAADCDCALECAYVENSCGWCRNRAQLLSEVKQ